MKPGLYNAIPPTTMNDGEEWLTTRELCLKLLCPTELIETELLTDDDLSML